MAYARLAPHCGLVPVYGQQIGNSGMMGGFSWSSFGNSLSSGLSRLGSFLGTTAKRVGASQGFQQAKQGFLNSGVLENVGALAGQTVSTLTDIGRLKLDQELNKLREKALGNQQQQQQQLTQEQIAQLLANVPVTIPAAAVPPAATLPPVAPPVTQPERGVALGPVREERPVAVPGAPRRKRKRVRGWGSALEDMLGQGVGYSSKRFCY